MKRFFQVLEQDPSLNRKPATVVLISDYTVSLEIVGYRLQTSLDNIQVFELQSHLSLRQNQSMIEPFLVHFTSVLLVGWGFGGFLAVHLCNTALPCRIEGCICIATPFSPCALWRWLHTDLNQVLENQQFVDQLSINIEQYMFIGLTCDRLVPLNCSYPKFAKLTKKIEATHFTGIYHETIVDLISQAAREW